MYMFLKHLTGDTRFTQTIYTQKSAWNSQTNFSHQTTLSNVKAKIQNI